MNTVAARVKPFMCLPVVVDVGTNNQELLDNKFYIGLNQKRASESEEEELIDELIEAAIAKFGTRTVIQFEDFKTNMAFKILCKYRNKYCIFNGDIQASGSLVMAGLKSAVKITRTKLRDNKIVFVGAGQPAIGTADLCVKVMVEEGLSEQEACDRIWMLDHNGLLVKSRENLPEHSACYAKEDEQIREIGEVVKKVKPTILIGLSRKDGAFTPEILSDMAKFNKRPVIFAMGNPCGKPECTAQQAYEHTEGKCIYASSQSFPPVTWNGKTHDVGFSNNAMIFPGIVLGAILCGIQTLDDEIFLIASQVVADMMSDSELQAGRVYPPFKNISECAFKIAENIIRYAHCTGIATIRPEPVDISDFIRKEQYNYEYDETQLPVTYPWTNLKELEQAKNITSKLDVTQYPKGMD